MLKLNRVNVRIKINKTLRSVVEMVKVIMGLKGSGKTKQLVELVKKAVNEEAGMWFVWKSPQS